MNVGWLRSGPAGGSAEPAANTGAWCVVCVHVCGGVFVCVCGGGGVSFYEGPAHAQVVLRVHARMWRADDAREGMHGRVGGTHMTAACQAGDCESLPWLIPRPPPCGECLPTPALCSSPARCWSCWWRVWTGGVCEDLRAGLRLCAA
jgi:hypothetical protein